MASQEGVRVDKIIDSAAAANLIKDGDTVIWTTAGLCGFAEAVATALEQRFLETGAPRDLTVAHSCGCGDGKSRGMNHLGHAGLVKRLISGHTGQAPRMGELIRENRVEGYLLPQGVLAHLWRHIAGNKPGVLSKVGLGTFVDPRLEGARPIAPPRRIWSSWSSWKARSGCSIAPSRWTWR